MPKMKTELEISRKIERIRFLEDKNGESTTEGEIVMQVLEWVLGNAVFPKGIGDSSIILR